MDEPLKDSVPSPWSASYSVGKRFNTLRFQGRTTRTGLLLLATGLPLSMLPDNYWIVGGALASIGASAVLWDRRTFGRRHSRLALLSAAIYVPVVGYMAALSAYFGARVYVHNVVPTYSILHTPWAPQDCGSDWVQKVNAFGPFSLGDTTGGFFGGMAVLNSILGLSFMLLGFQLVERRAKVVAVALWGLTGLANLAALLVITRNLAILDITFNDAARLASLDALFNDWRILSSLANPLWALLYVHAAGRIDFDLLALRAPTLMLHRRRRPQTSRQPFPRRGRLPTSAMALDLQATPWTPVRGR